MASDVVVEQNGTGLRQKLDMNRGVLRVLGSNLQSPNTDPPVSDRLNEQFQTFLAI
jgi:hypothetical protein